MKLPIAILAAILGLGIPLAGLHAQDYLPLQISVLPGVGLPFGIVDTGVSLGGIGNISGRIDIVQIGGVFNISGDMRGIQAAGVFNVADSVRGLQTAGVFDIASGVRGLQAAGVFNIAADVAGAQVAGVFNVARDVNGLQLGLVNVARDVHGLQAGLVNISRNGVLDLSGIYETQTKYYFGTFRTGGPGIHAFYSIGAPESDWFVRPDGFVFSTGIGARIGDSKGLFLDISAGVAQALGSDPARLFQGLTWSNGLVPSDVLAPWPVLNANLGLDMGLIHLIGGVSLDFDLASSPNVPEGLKKGWSFSDSWFGQDFTAWTKWYIGVGF